MPEDMAHRPIYTLTKVQEDHTAANMETDSAAGAVENQSCTTTKAPSLHRKNRVPEMPGLQDCRGNHAPLPPHVPRVCSSERSHGKSPAEGPQVNQYPAVKSEGLSPPV